MSSTPPPSPTCARASAAGRHRQARRPCLASFRLARGMDGPLARARPDGSQGHARSRARGQQSGALGRDRSRGPLLGGAVIVSDDAGQFGVGEHALCWVHAERLIHKLIPANDKQRNAVEVAKRMVWWFYRQLKDYKLAPNPMRAAELSARFDRI